MNVKYNMKFDVFLFLYMAEPLIQVRCPSVIVLEFGNGSIELTNRLPE